MKAQYAKLQPSERILASWDRPSLTRDDKRGIEKLVPHVGGFKIGLQSANMPIEPGSAITVGHALRVHLRQFYPHLKIFWDMKGHDIKNTMAGFAQSVAEMGVWAFTVHASVRQESLEAAVKYAGNALVTGVTVLTDHSEHECEETYGEGIEETVSHLAERHARADGHAIVCSPLELKYMRVGLRSKLLNITPGVRLPGADVRDQKRIMTPGEAVSEGADFLVCGQDIFGTLSWADNAKRIAANIGDRLMPAR
ncbi:MAG: orotidine 5'-phosphate decarboxylase [Candidatus Pacebacteria bacterium]|nr:orotidine 5'-phosphate decarboxylase [Candidatus Paceibacterota bacterium]